MLNTTFGRHTLCFSLWRGTAIKGLGTTALKQTVAAPASVFSYFSATGYPERKKNKKFCFRCLSVPRCARDDVGWFRLPHDLSKASRLRFSGLQLPPYELHHPVGAAGQRVVLNDRWRKFGDSAQLGEVRRFLFRNSDSVNTDESNLFH